MEQFSQLDFTGQTIFAGIDVHKKSWKVCLRNSEMELKTFSQNPSAQNLINHLRKNYPSATYKLVRLDFVDFIISGPLQMQAWTALL